MKYTIENIKICILYLWIRLKEIGYNYRKNIEFGNEVCNVSGLTIVNKYELKINK